MAEDYQSGMAQPELAPGMTITLEAIHPTDGYVVSGVYIGNVVISGLSAGGSANDLIELTAFRYVAGTPAAGAA